MLIDSGINKHDVRKKNKYIKRSMCILEINCNSNKLLPYGLFFFSGYNEYLKILIIFIELFIRVNLKSNYKSYFPKIKFIRKNTYLY